MDNIKQTEKHSDLIYDVGMHKGEDSDYYLRKGFRVVGFEADPDLAELCRVKFKQEIQEGRLILVEGAITEPSPGESCAPPVKFYKNKDKTTWGTVRRDWAERNEFLGTSYEVIKVPAINFTWCLQQYGIPHYLKIDIEGMDKVCLKALLHFEPKPDYVSIESEKVKFCKLEEEFDLFTRLGYSGFKAVQQKHMSTVEEPSLTNEGFYTDYRFCNGNAGLFGTDLPGKWKSYEQIIRQYKLIFIMYKYFGDYGILKKSTMGWGIAKFISAYSRYPGYYDTHARHVHTDYLSIRTR